MYDAHGSAVVPAWMVLLPSSCLRANVPTLL